MAGGHNGRQAWVLSQTEFTAMRFGNQTGDGDRPQILTLQAQQSDSATVKAGADTFNDMVKAFAGRHIFDEFRKQLLSGHERSLCWYVLGGIYQSVDFTGNIRVIYTHPLLTGSKYALWRLACILLITSVESKPLYIRRVYGNSESFSE
jgi:hypothetical protein